ncbi:RNA polymerase sigma factor [Flammeovirga kamogawensis]|uniref:Sigma-70 family RNA polymerase sigma factor n=1 Tax=Flammeovirga kamogawensis TaxID=373891 RepID=A0ABX8GQ79_9BACT|nr:sigma-70 family RNA polymerase sigma factor [Flammeovirga kamogawensis]MBB6462000.1 RNA polymerase sigma factor (sigma-70 family) [Flammeovirga kamogawensis]QWG05740.1 sigma-70 family RNA polymerase sigma factor [Flammeovirga kamogawensis]TRX67566.1 sigma-70 family RNA polymerase sigma factor [Flammeovirga kamogawensis]
MLLSIFKNNLTSEKIVSNLKNRNNYEYTVEYIYKKYFPTVKHIILKMNGSLEDAEDIFQDAFAKVLWSIDEGQFQGTSHISTYIVTVSKNMWLKTIEKNKKLRTTEYNSQLHDVSDHSSLLSEVPLGNEDDLESKRYFESLLSRIGEDCQKILKNYYFDKLSYSEIQHRFVNKYSSEQAIRNKKSRCLKYLKQGFENRTDDKEELLSIISSCL